MARLLRPEHPAHGRPLGNIEGTDYLIFKNGLIGRESERTESDGSNYNLDYSSVSEIENGFPIIESGGVRPKIIKSLQRQFSKFAISLLFYASFLILKDDTDALDMQIPNELELPIWMLLFCSLFFDYMILQKYNTPMKIMKINTIGGRNLEYHTSSFTINLINSFNLGFRAVAAIAISVTIIWDFAAASNAIIISSILIISVVVVGILMGLIKTSERRLTGSKMVQNISLKRVSEVILDQIEIHANPPEMEIKNGESKRVEFKASYTMNTKDGVILPTLAGQVVKEVVGLMNSDGGVIYIGVNDDHPYDPSGWVEKEIEYFENEDKYLRTILNKIDDNIQSGSIPKFDAKVIDFRGRKIVRLEVEKGIEKVWWKKEKRWIGVVRIGSSTKEQSNPDFESHWKGKNAQGP